MLAGLATPLVLSVHTIVSMDFATAVVPGWHTTIFPPYFVAGAIFSGMAMVLTLMLVARKTMRLEDYITVRHVDVDVQTDHPYERDGRPGVRDGVLHRRFYSGNRYEQFAFINRATGPLAWGYWIMVACNVLIPQLFWFARVRRTLTAVFIISLLVNVGMWFERFIIIVSSLERDYLPSSWASYSPTSIEIATLDRQLRPLLHLFSAVLPIRPRDRDRGDQRSIAACAAYGGAADAEAALPSLRASAASSTRGEKGSARPLSPSSSARTIFSTRPRRRGRKACASSTRSRRTRSTVWIAPWGFVHPGCRGCASCWACWAP